MGGCGSNNGDQTQQEFAGKVTEIAEDMQGAAELQKEVLVTENEKPEDTQSAPDTETELLETESLKTESSEMEIPETETEKPADGIDAETVSGNMPVISVTDDRKEWYSEDGKEISFGGMVTKFESRPSRKGGNFGIMAMEDYSGTCELRLFGQKYIDFSNYGKPGTPILVSGRFERRYNGEISFEVLRIRLLNDVKGNL